MSITSSMFDSIKSALATDNESNKSGYADILKTPVGAMLATGGWSEARVVCPHAGGCLRGALDWPCSW